VIQPSNVFKENLAQLPPIDAIARVDLIDDSGAVIGRIENQPGRKGSVAVYNYLQQTFGKLNAEAARHGLAVFAENAAEASGHPGSHPNIDRLFEIVERDQVLRIEVVAQA
jgi:hypothetical protein